MKARKPKSASIRNVARLKLVAFDQTSVIARDQELLRLRQIDPRSALASAERWLAETPPRAAGRAWALRAYANALRSVGAHSEALGPYQAAERLFDRLGLEVEAARTGLGHVWALRLVGRYEEALEHGLRTSRVFHRHGLLLESAGQTLNLGAVYRRLGKLEAARRCYVEARRNFRLGGDAGREATTESNLGNVLADLGLFRQAELAQRRAIRIYDRLGLRPDLARAHLNLGILHKRRGDLGRALRELELSQGIFQDLNLLEGLALVDTDLAETYLALNLHAEAANASEQAVARFARLGMPYEMGQAMLWAALVADRRGDRGEAGRRLREAAEEFQRIGNPLWEAVATSLAATVEPASEVALTRVLAAERRLARLGARARSQEARLVRADLLRRLGRRGQALVSYRAVVRAAYELGDEHLVYRAHAALGQLLENTAAAGALVHYRTATEHLEALRRRARADDLKLAFVSDKVDVYERTVHLLLRSGRRRVELGLREGDRLAEALATVERGKSAGLLDDMLELARHGGPSAAALAPQLRDLRARLGNAYAQRDEARGAHQPAAESNLKQLERETATATRALQIALRGETAAAPFDLARLRSALPKDAMLLEYYALGSEVVCFLIDRERLLLRRRLASVGEIETLAERLRFQIGKGIFGAAYLEANVANSRRSLDRVLRELWAKALAPLWRDLRGATQLLVVPHGPLHGLPLHAAHDGETYLADRCAISYVPSARALAACTERRGRAPRRALFVGPSSARLPGARREVRALARMFPNSDLLTGRRASLTTLRRRARRFDLLHLAAHGVFRADNPSFSALELADGWLSVGDLAELIRETSLVTLSACETGRGGLSAGEELLGLTRAVLGAGAHSLLASLWPVHDQATLRLMTEFYGALKAGQSKAASLQRAMMSVRQDLDSPFFWASFILAGAP